MSQLPVWDRLIYYSLQVHFLQLSGIKTLINGCGSSCARLGIILNWHLSVSVRVQLAFLLRRREARLLIIYCFRGHLNTINIDKKVITLTIIINNITIQYTVVLLAMETWINTIYSHL